MSNHDLLTVYRNYLLCLNERRWRHLGEYVADRLSYNGTPMALDDYRAMLEADTHAIPDLRFVAEVLVADDNTVACVLLFRCTPEHTFLGFEPTGARISFSEHVFYRFDDQRIVDVRSLIDTDAIRGQVAPQSSGKDL